MVCTTSEATSCFEGRDGREDEDEEEDEEDGISSEGSRSEVRGKMEEGKINCQYCIECQERDELVDRDVGPRSIHAKDG